MTKYRIHFRSGKSLIIDHYFMQGILKQLKEEKDIRFRAYLPKENDWAHFQMVHLDDIEFITAEESVDEASGIVKPPTPGKIREEEEEKKQERIASLDNIIDSYKEKQNGKLS